MQAIKTAVAAVIPTYQPSSSTAQQTSYECTICKDEEYIIDGWTAKECQCAAQKQLNRRMKNASIPPEYHESDLMAFKSANEIQAKMHNAISAYVQNFDDLVKTKQNSFGFLAEIGESRMREIKDPIRRLEEQRKHNNVGIGKTHLAVAAAKFLINSGRSVLIISDVTIMDKLTEAKTFGDEGEEFNRLLGAILSCDVLLWDDLAKSKYSEAKEKLYFRILDERFERRKPIIFTSNEDDLTIGDKIGQAAASRLFGMCGGRFYAVTGPDVRKMGV